MNLLESMMEKCVFLNHVRTDDIYGSSVDTWTDGSQFDAAIIKNSSTEATIAERQGVNEIYTVVTPKTFLMDYHDVFKRLSDNAVFRVTSRAKDSEAPAASTVAIAKVTAEKWVIPVD